MSTRRDVLKDLLQISATSFSLGTFTSPSLAATAEDLDQDVVPALKSLYKSSPMAQYFAKKAKGILVFPKIVKAGLVFGGSYGEGVLTKDSKKVGYFNSFSASFDWRAVTKSYGYVVFLMSDKAVEHLDNSNVWEFGVGPRVVVANDGIVKNLSTPTLEDDAYAFIFNRKGLIPSLSIEGTKISRILR